MPPKRKEKPTDSLKLPKIILYVLCVFGLLVILLISSIYRVLTTDLGDTYTVAVPQENGNADLYIFGLQEKSLVVFTIPSQTLVDVALQRGEWRIGSVFKLIESENLRRDVYPHTIVKSLNVPIDSWSSVAPNSLSFIYSDSGMSLSQKLKLLVSSNQVTQKNKEEVNFADTSYLYEIRHEDGEFAYKRVNEMSSKLRHYFISAEIASEAEKVEVLNATKVDKYGLSPLISTLETMGAHVLSVRDIEDQTDVDCVIQSRMESRTVQKIESVFDCDYQPANTGNFDIQIVLGDAFIAKF